MTDYERLKQIVDEIPNLISAGITSGDSRLQAWKAKAGRFLINKYGKDSYEYLQFTKTRFSLGAYTNLTPRSSFIEACQNGLKTSQSVFQTYLEEMEEEPTAKTRGDPQMNCTSIFIVHGHDGELKQSVARIIEKQGIEAVILSEQANQGKTIIEKFENYSEVGGAICLFTADDIGRGKNDTADQNRARQNVVFEAGFFMGSLGRDRVIILADDDIEIPSDLSGVVYTSTANWQLAMLRELRELGYTVDPDKLL